MTNSYFEFEILGENRFCYMEFLNYELGILIFSNSYFTCMFYYCLIYKKIYFDIKFRELPM